LFSIKMKIIINADDFGISNKVNEAILDLIKKDCLFSVSVLMREKINKKEINELIKVKEKISIGLHFEYNQKKPEDNTYQKIKEALDKQYERFIATFWEKPEHIDKHNREQSEIIFLSDCIREENISIFTKKNIKGQLR